MDFIDMTDTDIYDLIDDANTELGRRQGEDVFNQQIADIIIEARNGGVIEDLGNGEAWEQPVLPAEIYVKGDVVEHKTRIYRSGTNNNVREPGDTSDPQAWRWWVDITDGEPGTEEDADGNIIWSGQGIEYRVGQRRSHEGVLYRVVQSHTSQPGWAPDIVPALWAIVEQDPEPEPDPDEGEEEPTDPDPAIEAWSGDSVDYVAGDERSFEGNLYRVVQGHTSQPGWTPAGVPSLWELIEE